LQHSLAAEEHVMAARSNGQLASWEAQIQARIQRAWLRPPSARAGIDCIVYVTQVPGGEVVNVRLGECNGDAAVRESIQAAAFRASPLPPPPDPALFERNLEIQFKPVD
jgi:colicin import membrane protein